MEKEYPFNLPLRDVRRSTAFWPKGNKHLKQVTFGPIHVTAAKNGYNKDTLFRIFWNDTELVSWWGSGLQFLGSRFNWNMYNEDDR